MDFDNGDLVYLDALMTAKIKVKFGGMCNANIDGSARRNIATLSTLFFFISAE